MIFSTINQFNCFLIFVFLGSLVGLFSTLIFIIFLKNYQKNIVKVVFDTIFYAFLMILFIFFNIFLNFGELSIAPLIGYSLGIIWIRILTSKLVVFFEKKWYNYLNKRKRKLSERKSRKSQVRNISS